MIKYIYRLFHILSNLIFASQEIHVPHGSKMNKKERNLVRCIKMVWAPPFCDMLFIEMNNKLKRDFINSFPPKLSPYSIVQWFRGYSTNLKVMSLNSAGDFKMCIFAKKIFLSIFWLNIVKSENSKLKKVLYL